MMICYCRDVTLEKLAAYIKDEQIGTYLQIVNDDNFSCGDGCQACHEEGYHNDGMSLAMAVGMVKRGYL